MKPQTPKSGSKSSDSREKDADIRSNRCRLSEGNKSIEQEDLAWPKWDVSISPKKETSPQKSAQNPWADLESSWRIHRKALELLGKQNRTLIEEEGESVNYLEKTAIESNFKTPFAEGSITEETV